MATVKELFDSRAGVQTGLFGTTSFTLTYRVTCDAVGDNPIAVLAEHRDGLRIGSTIPTPAGATEDWSDFGVIVREFAIVDHPAPLTWVVAVIAGTPFVADPDRPWDLRISGETEEELVMFDIGNKPIGTYTYAEVTTDSKERQDLIAAGFDISVEFYTFVPKRGRVKLWRNPTYPLLEGATRTKKAGSITLMRKIPTLSSSQVGNVLSYINTVNTDRFYGAAPGALKFIGLDASSEPGIMSGQQVANVVWNVGMNFVWNPDGHQPLVQIDYFEVEGVRCAIQDNTGKPVQRKYTMYQGVSFAGLIAMLES